MYLLCIATNWIQKVMATSTPHSAPDAQSPEMSFLGSQGQGVGSPGEQVLYLLIQNHQLTPSSLAILFQTSKTQAQTITRHASRTQLAIRPSNKPNHTAFLLASLSHNVTLLIHSHWVTPHACLHPCITSLELHNMNLSPGDFIPEGRLQLHTLPNLITLSLHACLMHSTDSPTTLSHPQTSSPSPSPPMACVPPNLCELVVGQWSSRSAPALRTMLSLLNPASLRRISCSSYEVIDLLSLLPSLHRLQLSIIQLADIQVAALLTHPTLKHISIPGLYLHQDFSPFPCRWESLHLDSVRFSTLASLPLANIQFVSVHEIHEHQATDHQVRASLANVRCCPHFACTATSHSHWGWALPEPSFLLFLGRPGSDASASLASLTLRHLHSSSLMVHSDIASQNTLPLWMSTLASAPSSLRTVVFTHMQGAGLPALGMVSYLPAQVQHVVLCAQWSLCGYFSLRLLRQFMTGVTRAMQVTLLTGAGPWMEGERRELLEWLRENVNSETVVEFGLHSMCTL